VTRRQRARVGALLKHAYGPRVNVEVQRPSYGGDAFVAFYLGYAWLKMPVPDAQLLANLLIGTEFHNEVTRRWTPGSWRMQVPMIFDGRSGIIAADTAQIHFPRNQIPRLGSLIENLRG